MEIEMLKQILTAWKKSHPDETVPPVYAHHMSLGTEVGTSLVTVDNTDEVKVEPIKPVELSTSKALVPVSSEGIPNIWAQHFALNFPWFTLMKNDENFRRFAELGKNYAQKQSNDRVMRTRHTNNHFRSYCLDRVVARSTINEHLGLAWGKCKSKIQEHRMRLAASTNNVETVEQLLNAGISANNQDLRGRSPLHLSACRGYTEIVRILLQHNADPNLQDCIGNTPLHLATLTNKVPVVTLLLEAGAKVNTVDSRGFSPLYLAQTRLRVLQMCKCDNLSEVEKQMFEIVNMLRVYLKKLPTSTESSNWNTQMEKINDICSKLSLSETNKTVEVQDEVRSLLSSIEALNLS